MLFMKLYFDELETLQGKVRCCAIIAKADNNTVYTACLVQPLSWTDLQYTLVDNSFCFRSTPTTIWKKTKSVVKS